MTYDALTIFTEFMETLSEALLPLWTQHQQAGSFRRGRNQIKDLDILVIGDYEATLKMIEKLGLEVVVGSLKKDSKQHLLRFKMQSGCLVDLMFVKPEEWGSALMHHTGPVELNVKQRAMAKRQGLSLNQFGLWRGDEKVAGETERDVYLALGMPFLEPHEREAYAKTVVA